MYISAILTIPICDKCDSVVKKYVFVKTIMQCLTSEEADFMVHKKTMLVTNFPGAVTYMFETCDE